MSVHLFIVLRRMCSLAPNQFIHSANTFGMHSFVPGTVFADGHKLENEIMNSQKTNGPKFLDPRLKKNACIKCQLYVALCYFICILSNILISFVLFDKWENRLVRGIKQFMRDRINGAHIWTQVSWLQIDHDSLFTKACCSWHLSEGIFGCS